MPPLGRHTVNIGSSLGRALKARKGGPAPAKNKLPEKDFYSFRYNFKPESVDTTKPGTMELKKGKEATSVIVERANTQVCDLYILGITHFLTARDDRRRVKAAMSSADKSILPEK